MTVRSASCVACGQWFEVATTNGPLPARCPTCQPAYQRAASAERARRKKERRLGNLREIRCVDCRAVQPWDGLSRPRLRCDPCRKAHNLALSRVRYASERESDPELARERWRRGYRRNADRIREQKLDQHYRKRYGLTKVEIDELRAARNGLCDICKRPADPRSTGGRLHVDHCHATGRVRGLLCGHCNTMIGLAREDPAILLAAIEYLKRE